MYITLGFAYKKNGILIYHIFFIWNIKKELVPLLLMTREPKISNFFFLNFLLPI